MRCIIFLSVVLLFSCSLSEKHPTDKQMAGFKSPVKTLVSYSYRKITFVNGKWQPADTLHFSSCLINYFNNEGHIDSIIVLLRTGNNTLVKRRVVYQFSKGTKVSAEVYRNGILDEKHTITWNSKHSYTINATNKDNKLVFTLTETLDDSLRDEGGEMISYGENEKVEMHTKGKFIFGPDGWIKQRIETDVLKEKTSKYNWIQKNYDQYNTPLYSEEWLEGDTMPSKITIRKVEYY